MLKGAIFDHDGLMFDTEKIWQKNWNFVAKEMGITLPEEFKHEICGTSGELMNTVVKKYYGVEDGTDIMKRVKAAVHEDSASDLDEKKGLKELIEFFAKNDVVMAVASSSPVAMLERNLNNDGIRQYFKAVVSGEHVEHGKPAPDIFELAAKKIEMDPADCYVFEDAMNGVKAGHAAGCRTVMIPDMVQPNEETKEIADAILPSLLDVIDEIEKGNL